MAEPTTTQATAVVADPKPADATTTADSEQPQEQSPPPPAKPSSGEDTAAAASAAAGASAKGKEKDTRTRQDSLSIDRPEDSSAAAAGAESPSTSSSPTCNITLLLPTGARHPYKIDERYLAKRNVEIPELAEDGKRDPFSISIYKLKELILLEWREEWEGKPASPTSIRLIHFGKLLDDKEQLKSKPFFCPLHACPFAPGH
jgi:hypothetical protein